MTKNQQQCTKMGGEIESLNKFSASSVHLVQQTMHTKKASDVNHWLLNKLLFLAMLTLPYSSFYISMK